MHTMSYAVLLHSHPSMTSSTLSPLLFYYAEVYGKGLAGQTRHTCTHTHTHVHTHTHTPVHLTWQNMKFKGQVILLQETKAADPLGISEVVVMSSFAVLRLVGVEVEHVTDATETLVFTVSLQCVFKITRRQVSKADYG